jgi:carbamoyl-phosphate synthase large subunit
MPRRTDLKKICIIGSGPIVIGQACEFDYSGTQGAKALKTEGYEVVLVNSNPATIMTDPEIADRTYIEPLDPLVVAKILERERPDALLPTLGGQTALNLALALEKDGTLARLGIELIGASGDAIRKAEDRLLFKEAMERIGLASPKSGLARSVKEARAIARETGFPLVLRASFTLGGGGSGFVHRPEDLDARVEAALSISPVHEVLVEQSIYGWKEFELEVIRDRADNFIVVCAIENLDPMGVHTGDSITVAPPQTLTDREYQRLRDAARAIMSEIGVETGGANVQFAVNPETGELLVIEMNPRVSRSSALASKATGYPIAKVAAKLAIGYTLDELRNDITGTSAAFEPSIDYVVVKWPRFAFEKFPGSDGKLGTQMKSVGEVMAIGATFGEALQKAARSLETGHDGLDSLLGRVDHLALVAALDDARDASVVPPSMTAVSEGAAPLSAEALRAALRRLVATPTADRLFHVVDAMRVGIDDAELHALTRIDPWFLARIRQIVEAEATLSLEPTVLRAAKRLGFSDAQIASRIGASRVAVAAERSRHGITATYQRIDTCAAEFEGHTPYLYSTFSTESESLPSARRKIIILGGGPNRIGQGIEFDYCCVRAAIALREAGFETVMVNCNPETVSTDFDTVDRLYFEPLTVESVLAICAEESQRGELAGVIVQLGGQTPLKLANALSSAGIPILGTTAEAIDRAEDRGRFQKFLEGLGIEQPRGSIVAGVKGALRAAEAIGYPVLVRPSYVLGGRAMTIAHSPEELERFAAQALEAVEGDTLALLVDEYLAGAIEVDVDCVCDGHRVIIGGVIEHIEEAGIHSGDSAGVLPPFTLSPVMVKRIEEQTSRVALALGVVGLMNVQFAVIGERLVVLEVNPRASRTVPFVAKASGRALVQIAARVMAGAKLDDLGVTAASPMRHVAIKESVFPFGKLGGVDTLLGPEMRSTGEVMGLGLTFAEAFGKATLAAGYPWPQSGTILLLVGDADASAVAELGQRLVKLGYALASSGASQPILERAGLRCWELGPGSLREEKIALVIHAVRGAESGATYPLRRRALVDRLPYFSTLRAATAAVEALELAHRTGDFNFATHVQTLHDWYATGSAQARLSALAR